MRPTPARATSAGNARLGPRGRGEAELRNRPLGPRAGNHLAPVFRLLGEIPERAVCGVVAIDPGGYTNAVSESPQSCPRKGPVRLRPIRAFFLGCHRVLSRACFGPVGCVYLSRGSRAPGKRELCATFRKNRQPRGHEDTKTEGWSTRSKRFHPSCLCAIVCFVVDKSPRRFRHG